MEVHFTYARDVHFVRLSSRPAGSAGESAIERIDRLFQRSIHVFPDCVVPGGSTFPRGMSDVRYAVFTAAAAERIYAEVCVFAARVLPLGVPGVPGSGVLEGSSPAAQYVARRVNGTVACWPRARRSL